MTHPTVAHRSVGAPPTSPPDVDVAAIASAADLRRVADLLYDGIAADRVLRDKFGSDLVAERHKLGAFLVERYLRTPEWSVSFAIGDLAAPHRFIHITAADAARWLGHARQAVTVVAGDEVAARVVADLRPIADAS